jgi:hypothetical protein
MWLQSEAQNEAASGDFQLEWSSESMSLYVPCKRHCDSTLRECAGSVSVQPQSLPHTRIICMAEINCRGYFEVEQTMFSIPSTQ